MAGFAAVGHLMIDCTQIGLIEVATRGVQVCLPGFCCTCRNVWGSLQALSTQSTAQPPEASTFLVELPGNVAAKAAVSPSAAAPRYAFWLADDGSCSLA